jgi:hypothetical protein
VNRSQASRNVRAAVGYLRPSSLASNASNSSSAASAWMAV